MGCSSSAPFAADGGALGDVKNVADDMVTTGENAVHDMGQAAGKAAHEAVDHVKGAMSSAASGVQTAVDNVGNMASNAAHSISDGIRRETSVLTAPATPEPFLGNGSDPDACKHIPLKSPEDQNKKVNDMLKDIMSSTEQPKEAVPPLEKFKPTPAPSFDKPSTPGQISPLDLMDKPMQKIDEGAATLDQLTDELLKETEAVATEVTAKVNDTMMKELPPLDIMKTKLPPIETMKTEMDTMKAVISNMDSAMGEKVDDLKTDMTNVMGEVAEAVKETISEAAADESKDEALATEGADDLYMDVPPTKWEALADAIVELPPRMSIDLGTGQLYAVIVEDEQPKGSSRSRHQALKDPSSDSQTAKSAL